MNFVSETRNKSGTKNGFLGKSSFFCLLENTVKLTQ